MELTVGITYDGTEEVNLTSTSRHEDLGGNFFLSTRSGDDVSCLNGTNTGGRGWEVGDIRRGCGAFTCDGVWGEPEGGDDADEDAPGEDENVGGK